MKSIAFTEREYDLPYRTLEQTSAYIHLRTHPAAIDQIPELQQEPRLKPLVSILNDPGGIFMTHACAIGSRRPGIPANTEIRIPYGVKDSAYWYSSYVTFSFWYFDQNEKANYEAIYESYPSDKNQCSVAFEVQATYFLTPYERELNKKCSPTNGNVCLIWVSGWGSRNAKEAQDRWSSGIDDVVAFFTNFKSVFPAPTGITLSQHMLRNTV